MGNAQERQKNLPPLEHRSSANPEKPIQKDQPVENKPTPSSPPNEKDINGYVIIRTLGKGSFGEVYLVTPRESFNSPDRPLYALKKMPCKTVQEAQAPMQEGAILKTLDHPNVVRYQDLFPYFDQDQPYMCLVMEFIDGGTLTEFAVERWNDPKRWNTEVIMRWFLQFCAGVQYIHSKQVVHRDLKPDNLFVYYNKKSGEMQLKIADFGISNNVSKKTNDIAGTPPFMAPEQLTPGKYHEK